MPPKAGKGPRKAQPPASKAPASKEPQPKPPKENKGPKKAAPSKNAPGKAPQQPPPPKAAPTTKGPATKEAGKVTRPQPTAVGLHIKGLKDADMQTVKRLFAPSGKTKGDKIVNCRLRRHKYALVYYENAETARAVEQKVKHDDANRTLTITLAKSPPALDARENTKVVFVSPVFRTNTSRKQLRAYFAPCGNIVKMRMYRYNYAYVYFDSSAAAAKAIKEMHDKLFHGKKLVVRPSVRSMEQDAKSEAIRKKRRDIKKWKREQRADAKKKVRKSK